MARDMTNQRRWYAAYIESALDIQEARPQNLRDKAQVIVISSFGAKVIKQFRNIGTRPTPAFRELLKYVELVCVAALILASFACEDFDGQTCAPGEIVERVHRLRKALRLR